MAFWSFCCLILFCPLWDFISINIFIWRKYTVNVNNILYLQCRSMQHCKCDTFSDEINRRTNEPIFDTHPIYHHSKWVVTRTHEKKRYNFVELKACCVGLGFCFTFQCYKLHSELSWRMKWTEIMGEKVYCTVHIIQKKSACKFYLFREFEST